MKGRTPLAVLAVVGLAACNTNPVAPTDGSAMTPSGRSAPLSAEERGSLQTGDAEKVAAMADAMTRLSFPPASGLPGEQRRKLAFVNEIVPTPSSTPPPTPTPTPSTGLTVPILIAPINNQRIRQNDPTIGCLAHPFRGFGLRVDFDWTDSTPMDQLAGYHLFVKHPRAPNPAVDATIRGNLSGTSFYRNNSCNSFVGGAFLEGWEWRVRAFDVDGNFTDWSETGIYRFEPCRLSDGSPCQGRD